MIRYIISTYDSRMNGRAATKIKAGTKDAPNETRQPTALPRSLFQKVMAYPTLESVRERVTNFNNDGEGG